MSILFNEENRVFKLDTPSTTYAFHLSGNNKLLHLYYGASIPDFTLYNLRLNGQEFCYDGHDSRSSGSADIAPQEYSTAGVGDYREPALQVKDSKGNTACELFYKSHKIYGGKKKLEGLPASYANDESEATSLEITCTDPHSGLDIILQYSVFEKLDVITRSVKAVNNGASALDLKRVFSLCLELYGKDYDMITLHGIWAKERHIQRCPLHFGLQGVDSKRGCTSHENNNFVALCSPDCTEKNGEAYGFAFVYSGNFAVTAEVSSMEQTRLLVGINPYDFSWHLEPGEQFQTPEVIMTFSANGLAKMSNTFHDFMRTNLIRGKWRDIRRPILINNWEATYFDFDTDKLIAIAKEASEAGIEMLVMDDGWFGHRNDDRSSLGDWEVNENKIKGGLKHLVEEVNKLGLKFGIWFEPEMISPDSELYKAHPDWCLHIDGRKRNTARSQLVLDFSREDVRDCIYGKMKAILQSANIEYVKWDMNRQMTEVGNELLPSERQQELWHRYILGVYDMQERLITDFPDLLLENCAGGGARFDAGMLYYSPQIWTSDNTDAIERLRIQQGTSLCYPCSCFGAHVSDSPNHCCGRTTPFKTRGHVAMVGTFGYELDPTKLSSDDKAAIREQIAEFNKYNPLVRTGDFFRLGDPFNSRRFDAWQFVAKDKSETVLQYVQIMNEATKPAQRIRLMGLDPEAVYRLEENGLEFSGAFLMNSGFDVPNMWGDYQSYLAHFVRV